MDIYQVRITGSGKKGNHSVNIEKTFQVDLEEYKKAKTAYDFRGQALDEYIKRVVPYHYPGVIPTNVGVYPSKKKVSNNTNTFEKFIVGTTVGYLAGKTEKAKENKSKKAPTENESAQKIENKKIPYSFSKRLEIFDGLTFENYDEERTKTNLKYIYNHISEYNWESTENDVDGIITENNRSLNLCVGKYEEGLTRLKNISNNSTDIMYFEKLHNELIKKRESSKPWSTKKKIIIISLMLLLALFLLAIS